jgi:beta-glucosidase
VGNLEYSEALMMGYRQFDTEKQEPLFCFGHGLSYTNFLYGDLQCESQKDGWKLSFSVCNGTERAGSEVCQLYVRPLEPEVFRPMQELKEFVKVQLGPQETKCVHLDVSHAALAHWDLERWAFVSDAGQYELCIGSSSRDIRLQCMVVHEKSSIQLSYGPITDSSYGREEGSVKSVLGKSYDTRWRVYKIIYSKKLNTFL